MEGQLTVRSLLKMTEFSCLKLLAGRGGLAHTIDHVTLYKFGSIPYFSGNELVLTQDTDFSPSATLQSAMVRQMAERGIAAIATKLSATGDGLAGVPSAMIEACNKADLPLLGIDPRMTYRPLMQGITQKIASIKLVSWVAEMNQLLRFEDEATIFTFCNWVEEKAMQPCVIIDADNKLFSGEAGRKYLAAVAINTERIKRHMPLYNHNDIIIGAGADATRVSVFDVHTASGIISLLLIMESMQAVADTSLGYIGSSLLAHLLEERESIYRQEAQRVMDYFQITREPLASMQDSIKRHFNFELTEGTRVLLARCQEKAPAKLCTYWCSLEEPGIFSVNAQNLVIGIVPAEIAPECYLPGADLGPVLIGVGNTYTNPNDILSSFQEAKFALESQAEQKNGGIFFYNELGVCQLVLEKQNASVISRLLDVYLLPLLQYDRAHHTELVSTLNTYFHCNRSLKTTAEQMVIGKTTLFYRINKIESILGILLSDYIAALNLQVALLALPTLGGIDPPSAE